MKLSRWFAAVAVVGSLTLGSSAQAVTYKVSIDTSAISGTVAQLALDFIDGGPLSNSVLVTSFTTDGTLGASLSAGGVAGTLPGVVTLTDSAFFSELLTEMTLGNSLLFLFDPSASPPDPGSLPDAFTVYLLDVVTGLPLFDTTDPTSANALFQFDIDGSRLGALTPYAAPGGAVTLSVTRAPSPVPEPSVFLLLSLGLAGIYLHGRLKSRETSV